MELFQEKKKRRRMTMENSRSYRFNCKDCAFKTNNKGNYTTHLMFHSGEYRYWCESCDYKSNNITHFNEHRMQHTGEYKYHCVKCDYKTNHRSGVIRHEMKHSGEFIFHCGECDYKTNCKTVFSRHAVKHSEDYKNRENDSNSKFENGVFRRINHSGEYKFRCEHCDYKTNTKILFTIHVRDHSGEYKYNCKECEFRTNNSSKFKRHNSVHSDEYKYYCNFCDYKSNYKKSFTVHLLNHSGSYKFKCGQCNYATNRRNNFNSHAVTHSGEYKFNCNECEYKTNNLSQLVVHKMNHTGTYKFHCDHCDYKTNNKANFIRHVNSHHKEKVLLLSSQPLESEITEIVTQSDINDEQAQNLYENSYINSPSWEYSYNQLYEDIYSKNYTFHCVDCDYMKVIYPFLYDQQVMHNCKNNIYYEIQKNVILENGQNLYMIDYFKCVDAAFVQNSEGCSLNNDSSVDNCLKITYQCDSCDYITDKISYLISHEMEHTQEKLFYCLLCSYNSFSRDVFLHHYNLHRQMECF